MPLSRGLFTTGNGEWRTPKTLLAALEDEFGAFFDPCPGGTRNGLQIPWRGNVYCNPPYGHVLSKWIRKGIEELQSGRAAQIVWLLPARTDTRWFHDLVVPNAVEIRFLRGRIHFSEKGPAPFPSMIVVMKADQHASERPPRGWDGT